MKLAGAYINDDTYERLVALASANNRTLAGQCRHLFDRALKGHLQVPDAPARKPALPAVACSALPVPLAQPGSETFPVAGNGVAAVGPVAVGFAATPKPPAAGHPRAARCAGKDACGGSYHDGRFFDTTPEPNTQRPCLHPLPPSTPADANNPPTAARRTAR